MSSLGFHTPPARTIRIPVDVTPAMWRPPSPRHVGRVEAVTCCFFITTLLFFAFGIVAWYVVRN